jgi:predicted dehydrogenase
MTTPIRLGIVGLGAMGHHLLAEALDHPDFTVTHAVDLAPATVAALQAEHPGVSFSTSIADVIGAEGIDAVYIATPPATHAALVVPAFAAGQAVFCEKPLAVSDADAAVMLEAAAGKVAGVNFSLSDRQSTRYVEQAIADGRVGDVLGSEATRLTLFGQAVRGEHPRDLADFGAGERVRQVVEAFHR